MLEEGNREARIVELEAVRRARLIDAAIREELARAFRFDRDANPVTVMLPPLPRVWGANEGVHESVTVSLPPLDQARIYLSPNE